VRPTAWKLYRYSLLYLALLFLAMAIDRNLPWPSAHRPTGVLILSKPQQEAIVAPSHPH
jgi:hypothetical protein